MPKAKPDSQTENDSVWKEVLERFFPEFVAFFFPQINEIIDWTRPYEFLDTELAKLFPKSQAGKRLADKLVRVYRKDTGEETWLLIHIEVQGYADSDFEERMYVYNYRIFDRFYQRRQQSRSRRSKQRQATLQQRVKVISLALLTDAGKNYRPGQFQVKEPGYELTFRFPTVKLIDYNNQWAKLETDPNPFALVVMAQLKAQQEKSKPEQLLDWKVRLVELLYERKYSEERIAELFKFIDWLMFLPAGVEPLFRERLARVDERRRGVQMPYVTSIERLARKEGAATVVTRLLNRRFGELEPEIIEQVQTKLSVEQLEELGEALLDMTDKTALESWLSERIKAAN